jgi:hypothetical protein
MPSEERTAYERLGAKRERSQTCMQGASPCDFRFRRLCRRDG